MRAVTGINKLVTFSAIMALVAVVFGVGFVMGTRSPLVGAQGDQPQETEKIFEPFWESWALLHEGYVDPLNDTELMEGALTGMMSSLGDPHSDYMSPDVFDRVNQSMSGEYEGIGATVRQDETTGGLELVSILRGSPAEKAGLRAGDQIVEVDGEDVTDLGQNEIVALVRGPAGTPVVLGIVRPDEPEQLEIEVIRGKIANPSVIYEVLEGEIGYLRLNQFNFTSSQEMREGLEAMDANNLKGLILDVRGNPGGYLTTSIEVASAYIPEGVIVTERGPDSSVNHMALENATAPDVPMVILVDEGSASASELIAGALQDHDRAVVMGMKTFGKGSVQTWHTLSNGGGLRITVSRWYTPDGHSVSEVGITPDVEVPFEFTDEGIDTQLEAARQLLSGPGGPRIGASETEPASPGADTTVPEETETAIPDTN